MFCFGMRSIDMNSKSVLISKYFVTIVTLGTIPNLDCGFHGFGGLFFTLIFVSFEATFVPKNLVTFVTLELGGIVRDINVTVQIIFTCESSVTLVTRVFVLWLNNSWYNCYHIQWTSWSCHAFWFQRLHYWVWMYSVHVNFKAKMSIEFSIAFGTWKLIILCHSCNVLFSLSGSGKTKKIRMKIQSFPK